MPSKRRTACALTLLLILSAILVACEDPQAEGGGGREQPPAKVRVTEVSMGPVAVHEQYAGRAAGSRKVQIRARVDGTLEKRGYVEGALVDAGEALFRIDPAPFEAALARAEAQLQRARAALRQAQRDWERMARLYERDAVSTRERDDARSALELARADVAVAEAGVLSAEIELGYTTVEAPLGGVTSLEVLPEGSLVRPGDLLTTITELDPIHVRFALPERDALAQQEARRAMGADEGADGRRQATLIFPDGETHPRTGEVDFTDASIDPATGTVRARAVFPNPEHTITPGLFVRVELRTATLEGVAVVPETAVASGPEGPVVYVVDDQSVASAVPVELGPVVENGQVIRSGLDKGDRVAVSGLVGLRDGAKVEIVEAGEDK
ncbi:efflux RND transporter periplasmic adaptor subunit [Arhodomonas sp. SL1]|uniref:efflux RND transporter periplasmic adaptor subunit n=1 Tax=Arhodomonas sp. SL1 TaxID=3425691 RepID=UPI003F885280